MVMSKASKYNRRTDVSPNKKSQSQSQSEYTSQEKPATLKELLGADTIAKLKQRSDDLKQQAADKLSAQRAEEERKRKEEQKRNENDFAYLLEHSKVNPNKYI
jgi:hypothetical protein